MYPLKGEADYPKNAWYVAAWSSEVGDKILARRILDIPLAIFRNAEGEAVVLDDRCPHRRYPLSKGSLENGIVTCGYHGFAFNGDGRCVRVPSQSSTLESQRVRSYPACEVWNWIWVWPGDAALADASLIPDHAFLHDGEADWLPMAGECTPVRARYMLLHDNLLDLSHLTYLHKKTVGSPGIATAALKMKDAPYGLELLRRVEADQVEDTPLGRAMGIRGPADRIMVQQFLAPCLHVTGPEFRSAEAGGLEPGRVFGAFRVIHAIVPETPKSTHYFWGFTRNFRHDEGFGETLRATIHSAVVEDVDASEEIERLLAGGPEETEEIHSPADAASLRGRRIMQRLIDDEASGQDTSSTATAAASA